MKKLTHVISGFSGTMKSTISKLMFPELQYVGSPTKYARDFNDRLCDQCLDINPIHNLMVRMFQMRLLIDKEELVVERSIFDYLYFAKLFNIDKFTRWNEEDLQKLIAEWDKYAGETDNYVIFNNAPEFTKKYVIGSDKSRNDVYSNVNEYIKGQLDYFDAYRNHVKEYKFLELTDLMAFQIIHGDKVDLHWESRVEPSVSRCYI